MWVFYLVLYFLVSFRQPPPGSSEIQLHKEPPAAYLEADLEVRILIVLLMLLIAVLSS